MNVRLRVPPSTPPDDYGASRGPGGRRIDADYRVTAFEPNSRLAFEAIAGPVRPMGEYVLEEVDGGTRLGFVLHAELGGIKKPLMGGAVQKTMEVRATERLKSVPESTPDGSGKSTTPCPEEMDQDRDRGLPRR